VLLPLPLPDNINYDQELVDAPPDSLPDWTFCLVAVVVWIGVPGLFWAGIVAWFVS
jgi:hypothetical protein